MKAIIKILGLILILFIFSCSDDEPIVEPQDRAENKIMCLGASRVQGARPAYESYRYELWKDLVEGGWTFDYIGTLTDGATYPSFEGQDFDTDHEGRGGWTSGQILNGIDDWLSQAGSPDIVLFSSPGGNDALTGLPYENIITNTNAIIDAIQEVNPNVTIIVEQMAPGHSSIMTDALSANFSRIQQDVITIATEQTTTTSQVLTVDMFTGFTDDLLADQVHYNDAGADFIATRYYNVLKNVLEQ